MYNIIQKRKIWLSLSAVLIIISILSLIFWGIKLGIDFTGGSLIELEFATERPDNQQIHQQLADLELDSLNIQPIGENGILMRTTTLTEEKHQQILEKINNLVEPDTEPQISEEEKQEKLKSALGLEGEGVDQLQIDLSDEDVSKLLGQEDEKKSMSENFTELRFDSIGPTIGKELQHKTIYAIIIVLFAIMGYIAYAFRKVSKPVESWKYGISAIIALGHDILLVIGIFSILGHFLGTQIDSLFVTALLTILGFSVHDTIVTFDRIRENLHRHQDKTFETVVNQSINETIVRSLNTSLTTLFVLTAAYIFGGATIKNFILALILGIIFGTYSSIFVACPFLLIFYKLKRYNK
ncbi:protein translocase subunit SecF [Patescibacteria group bacterium]|nr:protein translocase subunit SecF [Patescibacteria group bacterium]